MVFLTNNLEWSAQTIADLYRCRWQIEVFFKQIKQTLQLADFLGNSASAVRWQVWTALLLYLLLRFCAWLSQWGHSFTRLFALLRSALWQKLELRSLLEVYGIAGGGGHFLGNSANAVRWQVWTALLLYLLLRFCAWLSQWGHSFTRLFALLRSALWQKLELHSLLEVYGTAGGGGRFLGTPQQAYLAGFG